MTLGGTSRALLVFSVDAESGDEQQRLPATRELTGRLIDLFSQYQMPATWAFSRPEKSPLSGRLKKATVRHEIALLADQQWGAADFGRSRLARQLTDRTEAAHLAGLDLVTLAIPTGSNNLSGLSGNLDLLVKNKLGLIRPACKERGRLLKKWTPRSQRFGVWQAPHGWQLPASRPWWQGGGNYLLRRQLRRAVSEGKLMHVHLDVPRMLDGPPRTLRAVEGFLKTVHRYRRQTLLETNTLDRLIGQRPHPRATGRSLLRAA